MTAPSRQGNLLITGRPGVGKTTLIRDLILEMDLCPAGFYTREIKESGRRVGFSINSLTPGLPKMEGILAREGLSSPFRVSRYGVNKEDMEEVGARALEEGTGGFPLIVIDEIGNMEVISLRFQQAVIACLESSTPVLGVIKAGEGTFVSRIKLRDDVEIIELTRPAFERVKARVKTWLNELSC